MKTDLSHLNLSLSLLKLNLDFKRSTAEVIVFPELTISSIIIQSALLKKTDDMRDQNEKDTL